MSRYYQLTPEILLEYVSEDDPKLNEDGVRGNLKDIHDNNNATTLLKSDAFGTKYLFFNPINGNGSLKSNELNNLSNLVLPLNNTETQFVIAKGEYQNFYSKINASNLFSSNSGRGYMYEDTNYATYIKKSCKVKYDKCVVHFTSRNYFGSYDSLIFQAYAYMNNKDKLYLASFIFKKTSNLELKAEHLLYNEKLYTTQIEFDIPSVSAIFAKYNGEADFIDALRLQNIELLENTPIGINIYGVSGSILGADNYERLKTFKINNITIPYVYNRLDEINVNIREADDGDYYIIDPDIGPSYSSFVDYIESMGESIQSYMVMHELYLKESWVDDNGVSRSEITHKECHIISINEDDEDVEISKEFDTPIKYRPICTKGGLNYIATIVDTIKVINIVDSSSYEVTGSLEIANPYKYGKKMKRLGIKDDNRPIVNVYNKKPVGSSRSASDSNLGNASVSGSGTESGVIVLNKGGGFVIENNTQNITSFIECTNVGVSIVELSPEEIN